jgi:hypothetical protein
MPSAAAVTTALGEQRTAAKKNESCQEHELKFTHSAPPLSVGLKLLA